MNFKLVIVLVVLPICLFAKAKVLPPSEILILKDLNAVRSSVVNNNNLDTNRIKIGEDLLTNFPNYQESFSKSDIDIEIKQGFFKDTFSQQCIVLIQPKNENLPVERFFWKERYCILFLYDFNKKAKSWKLISAQSFYNYIELIELNNKSRLNSLYVNKDNCIQGNCEWIHAVYFITKGGLLNELYFKNSFDKMMYIEYQLKDSVFNNEFERYDVYKAGDTIANYSNLSFVDEDHDHVKEIKEEELVNIFKGITNDDFHFLSSKSIVTYKFKNQRYQIIDSKLIERKDEVIKKSIR